MPYCSLSRAVTPESSGRQYAGCLSYEEKQSVGSMEIQMGCQNAVRVTNGRERLAP